MNKIDKIIFVSAFAFEKIENLFDYLENFHTSKSGWT